MSFFIFEKHDFYSVPPRHFALPNILRHDSHDVGAEGGRTDQRAGQAVAAVELDHRAHQTSSTLLEITLILPSSTIGMNAD